MSKKGYDAMQRRSAYFFNPLAANYLLPVPNVIKKLVRNVRIAAIS
jgi:hypothetical protein